MPAAKSLPFPLQCVNSADTVDEGLIFIFRSIWIIKQMTLTDGWKKCCYEMRSTRPHEGSQTRSLTPTGVSLQCDAVMRKISNARSWDIYGPYHGLKLPNHGIRLDAYIAGREYHKRISWASSTGFEAVSKFKPCLPRFVCNFVCLMACLPTSL